MVNKVVALLLLENPLDIPSNRIIEILHHWLNNFWIFDDNYYIQNIGVPMGSPISCFVAEAVMRTIEAKNHGTISSTTVAQIFWWHVRHHKSQWFGRHLGSHNIKVAQKPTATLRDTLVKAKDTIPLDAEARMIYQFPMQRMQFYIGWRNW